MRIVVYIVAIILIIIGASDLRAGELPATRLDGLVRLDSAKVELAHVRIGTHIFG
jgi:hypothetical protein